MINLFVHKSTVVLQDKTIHTLPIYELFIRLQGIERAGFAVRDPLLFAKIKDPR